MNSKPRYNEADAIAKTLDTLKKELSGITIGETELKTCEDKKVEFDALTLQIANEKTALFAEKLEHVRKVNELEYEYREKIAVIQDDQAKSKEIFNQEMWVYQRAVTDNDTNYLVALHDYEDKIKDLTASIMTTEREQKSNANSSDKQKKSLADRIAALQKTSLLIGEVPCNDVPGLPEKCKLLKDANEAKASIPGLRDELNALTDQASQTYDKFSSDLIGYQSALADLEKNKPVKKELDIQEPIAMYRCTAKRLPILKTRETE